MLRAYGRFLDDYRQAPLHDRQPSVAPARPARRCCSSTGPAVSRPSGSRRSASAAISACESFDRQAEADLRDWLRQGAARRPRRGRAAGAGRRAVARLADHAAGAAARSSASSSPKSPTPRPACSTTIAGTIARDACAPPSICCSKCRRATRAPACSGSRTIRRARTPPAIKGDIVRLRLIEQLLDDGADLDEIDPQVIRQLGQLGRRYDAGDLRRFAKPKRDALVACYLIEARKTLLDQLVEMNDQFLTGMNRRAQNTVEDRQRECCAGAPATAWIACSAPSMRWPRPTAIRPSRPSGRQSMRRRLVEAAAACRAFERLEERGHLDAMLARYGMLRQYLPAFLALPFQAAVGSESSAGARSRFCARPRCRHARGASTR